jgi:hypothetical protein
VAKAVLFRLRFGGVLDNLTNCGLENFEYVWRVSGE